MFSILKTTLFSLTLGAALMSSVSRAEDMAMAPATQPMASAAVACDKCEMVWVKTPITVPTPHGGGGTNIVGYSTSKKMECPDCRDAVSNFFATGNLKHDCKTCGGNMKICEAH